jgi:hypothetical protein
MDLCIQRKAVVALATWKKCEQFRNLFFATQQDELTCRNLTLPHLVICAKCDVVLDDVNKSGEYMLRAQN